MLFAYSEIFVSGACNDIIHALSDDVDTDLLRLLANKTLHVNKGEKNKPKQHWSMQNGTAPGTLPIVPEQL